MKHRLLIVGVALSTYGWPAAAQVWPRGTKVATQIEAFQVTVSIVLGDVTFKIASDARFYAQDERTAISFSRFKEGDWVEFSVNSNGEIDEMWFSSE